MGSRGVGEGTHFPGGFPDPPPQSPIHGRKIQGGTGGRTPHLPPLKVGHLGLRIYTYTRLGFLSHFFLKPVALGIQSQNQSLPLKCRSQTVNHQREKLHERIGDKIANKPTHPRVNVPSHRHGIQANGPMDTASPPNRRIPGRGVCSRAETFGAGEGLPLSRWGCTAGPNVTYTTTLAGTNDGFSGRHLRRPNALSG